METPNRFRFRQISNHDSSVRYFELSNPHGCVTLVGSSAFWHEPQQSTGLADSNGVEIFEGDIVRFWCDNRAAAGPFSKNKVIVWEGGHTAGFSAVNADGREPFSVMWSCEYGGREVIGNIHQNHELLSIT
jgi:uncharacterized phage protein (TIGR01671 family)